MMPRWGDRMDELDRLLERLEDGSRSQQPTPPQIQEHYRLLNANHSSTAELIVFANGEVHISTSHCESSQGWTRGYNWAWYRTISPCWRAPC
jgi:hypothetical protein